MSCPPCSTLNYWTAGPAPCQWFLVQPSNTQCFMGRLKELPLIDEARSTDAIMVSSIPC